MTIEESKNLWKIEQEHLAPLKATLDKSIVRLYEIVDKKINDGSLLYEQFTQDTMDALTEAITESEEGKSREDVVKLLTNKLINKYSNNESDSDK